MTMNRYEEQYYNDITQLRNYAKNISDSLEKLTALFELLVNYTIDKNEKKIGE